MAAGTCPTKTQSSAGIFAVMVVVVTMVVVVRMVVRMTVKMMMAVVRMVVVVRVRMTVTMLPKKTISNLCCRRGDKFLIKVDDSKPRV